MADRIRVLPDSVANQIAAGEVVYRPASVVKETMENSVDASASSVTVRFRGGGLELIHIVDDGCGMSPVDARLAFDKHATSKIVGIEDIYRLRTFGFRGEALASIAAVGQVELLTRQAAEEVGIRVRIEGGRFCGSAPAVCPAGTQLTVRNLFYNVPARRRFMDKSTTETRHIVSEFQRVALCHPQVAFALYNGDAPLYNLPSGSLRQRVLGIMGRAWAQNLLDVSTQTSIVTVEGFVSPPSAVRQSARDQYMFVNGRFFRSPYFHKAVVQAYDKLIPAGTQPSYFLYFTIDPQQIDVNVHPQKTEVKFAESAAVWQIVHASVRESLARTGYVSLMDFDREQSIDIPVRGSGKMPLREPPTAVNPGYNPFSAPQPSPAAEARDSGGTECVSFDDRDAALAAFEAAGEPAAGRVEKGAGGFGVSDIEFVPSNGAVQTKLPAVCCGVFEDIMQLAGGYAVARQGGRLVVIDLARARESMLFDHYMLMLGNQSIISQRLMFAESLVLTREDTQLLRERREDFEHFGFEYVVVDDESVELTGIPADFRLEDTAGLIERLSEVLREHTGTPDDLRRRALAAEMAAAGARIRTGAYNEGELRAVFESLAQSRQNMLTPSGKQVMVYLGPAELKRLLDAKQ